MHVYRSNPPRRARQETGVDPALVAAASDEGGFDAKPVLEQAERTLSSFLLPSGDRAVVRTPDGREWQIKPKPSMVEWIHMMADPALLEARIRQTLLAAGYTEAQLNAWEASGWVGDAPPRDASPGVVGGGLARAPDTKALGAAWMMPALAVAVFAAVAFWPGGRR